MAVEPRARRAPHTSSAALLHAATSGTGTCPSGAKSAPGCGHTRGKACRTLGTTTLLVPREPGKCALRPGPASSLLDPPTTALSDPKSAGTIDDLAWPNPP